MTSRVPVAIVGIGCRFPGGVTDARAFWRLLTEGRDAIAEIPKDRIDLGRYFDPRPATPGRMMTRWGGFLERIEEFDALFFGISPREAERLDPQQRLVLETAWEALEDAGVDTARLEGSDTGVFVGQWLSDFEGRLFADPEAVDFQMTTGSGRYATSGRLSYCLGLRGPSLTIDTACSSSLVAVNMAAAAVRNGECGVAIAGGTNVILQPHISVAYSQSRMMAPDGHCKFGDASGDGYVRSEGAALVVLKPLDRAIADGDRVYALVRGGAVNNDGRSSGSMGTPAKLGQEELLRRAYRDAAVDPSRVGYVEAHGTGTRAGDPVELGALGRVLGEGRAGGDRARVGSVKTNIGHTEGTAGVAGVIKAALSLHHESIPKSLHCKELNPAIDWPRFPLEVAREASAWPRTGNPRIAGISAFGIAGTNAHVVLEEAPLAAPHAAKPATRALSLLPLSARSPEALRALAARYGDLLSGDDAPALGDVCWSAATRRTALSHRAAFIAPDAVAMVRSLHAYAAGEAATAEGVADTAAAARIAFVVPGQGAQWTGMARSLMATEPVFREALERCDAAAGPWFEGSILEQLALDPGAPGYRLDRIDVIQPVLVALAIAYAELWRSLGVEPHAVVGHSMGEVGAAYLAGAIDLDRAMQVICRRSTLMRRGAGQGAMALVELSLEDAGKRLAGREDKVGVGGNNSPRSSVISGEPEAVKQVLAELERDGIFGRLVKVDVASHSPQMQPHADDLARELAGMASTPPRIPMHSTSLGRPVAGTELDAAYWARNLRHPVLFGGAVQQLLDDGTTVFAEMGPHPVLLPSIQQTAQAAGREVATLVCGRREEPEAATFLAAYAGLWAAGGMVDWHRFMPEGGRSVALPLYPWQRERYWVREAAPVEGRLGAKAIRLEPRHESMLHQPRWAESPFVESAATRLPSGARVLIACDAPEPTLGAYREAFAAEGMAAEIAPVESAAALLRSAPSGKFSAAVLLAEGSAPRPFALVSLLQAGAGNGIRLHAATVGAQVVPGRGQSRAAVEAAGLWGAGRVLAEEHPDLWGGLVDLDPGSDAAARAAGLARELRRGDGEAQVALRGADRFVLRLQPLDASTIPESAAPWNLDGAWLVTGGLGGVPLQLAAGMVANGARRLVLLGRTGLPPRAEWASTAADSVAGRRIAAVRALESAGAAVHLLVADTGDARVLEAALAQYHREGYPPIRGLVHAAGVLDTRLALQADAESMERVWAPKVEGAMALDRLLPDLERCVLVSSIAGTLGFAGMTAYAAANTALDALAHDRRLRGLHGVSVQSGPWLDTGMHSGDHAHSNMEQLRSRGIDGFDPQDGVRLFSVLVGSPAANVLVMPVDWAKFAAARRGRDLRLYANYEAVAHAGTDAASGSLAQQLDAAAPAERRKLLEPVVRDAVARVLKLAPTRVDVRKPLGGMGLNSLMAMELRNRLEAALARPLSATLAWNYPTVEALVGFLAGDAKAAPAPAAPARAPSAAPAAELAAVAQLSDEDAARALRRKR